MHQKLKESNKVALASFFIVQEQPNIKFFFYKKWGSFISAPLVAWIIVDAVLS